jgi:N-acetylglucosaminyldiphosphoundecaprenol N-acetyl-beta-D-mannosaminyltransferase
MGLPIDRVDEAGAIAFVMAALERGRGGWIVTPNLDQLRQFRARPELGELFEAADLVVADGMPLVWASRIQRTPLPERVAGSELVWSLSAEAALHGRSVYLLGDVPVAREMAERRLRASYPGLHIAGGYSPPLGFESDPAELERVRALVLEARPDIVYVALGFPKQERLIAALREHMPGTWFVGVGISLSFVGGYVRRAPEWVARAGLEWAYRVVQEPRRLAKRYLVHGLPFAVRLFGNSLAMRALGRRPTASRGDGARVPGRRVVFRRGASERARADALDGLIGAVGGGELPVSVVIPAYRRPEMVERALRSVRAQRLRPAEVIVVDDASGDDTGARAAALGARLITHERNLGRGAARNTGLRAAEHEWVALLDCDDEWLASHLETLWAARGEHAIVGTAALVTPGPGSPAPRTYGWTGRRGRTLRSGADVAVPENKLVTSATMVRRQVALDAGGFRTDMPRAEDLDLWARMLARGSGLAIPRVTALYHLHPGQVSADAAQMWEAHRTVLDRHGAMDGRLRRRGEGVLAWDEARAAVAGGTPAARAALGLARRLASPQRAVGVAQLLSGRRRARRMAGRLAPSGAPSVALLPGAGAAPAVAGAVDLRGRSLGGALVHLMLRPTGRALVAGRPTAMAVRALGIEPVRAPRGGAAPLE